MKESYAKQIVKSGSRPIRPSARKGPGRDSMPPAGTTALALVPFSGARPRPPQMPGPQRPDLADETPGSARNANGKEGEENRIENAGDVTAIESENGGAPREIPRGPNGLPTAQRHITDTQSDEEADTTDIPTVGLSPLPSEAGTEGQPKYVEAAANTDRRVPPGSGSAPVTTGGPDAGNERRPESGIHVYGTARPRENPDLPRENGETVEHGERRLEQADTRSGGDSAGDGNMQRQASTSTQHVYTSHETGRPVLSGTAGPERSEYPELNSERKAGSVPGISANPFRETFLAARPAHLSPSDRVLPGASASLEVFYVTPRKDVSEKPVSSTPRPVNRGTAPAGHPAASMEKNGAAQHTSGAQAHRRIDGHARRDARPAYAPAENRGSETTGRSSANLRLPAAGGSASSRRTDAEPRITIQHLDVQFISHEQPEPPRQIAHRQTPSESQNPWEGVDRHLLHRSSSNL